MDAMILLGRVVSKQAQTENSCADFDDGLLALRFELERGLGEVLGLDRERAGDLLGVVETFEVIFLLVHTLRGDVRRGVAFLEVCTRDVSAVQSGWRGLYLAKKRSTGSDRPRIRIQTVGPGERGCGGAGGPTYGHFCGIPARDEAARGVSPVSLRPFLRVSLRSSSAMVGVSGGGLVQCDRG